MNWNRKCTILHKRLVGTQFRFQLVCAVVLSLFIALSVAAFDQVK